MKTYTNLKITLTLILFMICSISGYMVGQTSTNDGDLGNNESHTHKTISPENNWTSYTYNLWSGNNNLKPRQHRFHNDSVEVDGKWYFQLQWTRSQEDENWNNLELYREENGKIFVYAWGAESLLMDFNVEEGEVLSIYQPLGSWTNHYSVVSVDSIELLDGSLRKRVVLGCYDEDFGYYYWVEGIGSLNQNFFLVHCAVDIPHNPILCFYQNGEMIYSNEHYDECWITTSVTDIHSQGINIYPNPTTDFLTIEFDDAPTQDIMFTVYDYTGKQTRNFHYSGFQSLYRIEVSDFSTGFYYLTWELDGRPFVYHFVVAE